MDRKEMVRHYKETPRPAGVYRILHTPTGRTLLGASPDAPAMLNRLRMQLKTHAHRNGRLQGDWDQDGPDAFSFEVLDLLSPSDDPEWDPAEDLRMLEELWAEKLGLSDEQRY